MTFVRDVIIFNDLIKRIKMYPIKYKEPVFRPPSEGRSFLIQVTLGCSNNMCTYCDMYRSKKYQERPFAEIKKELIESRQYFESVGFLPSRIFLCDGDALGASMELLESTLILINELFPNLDRVGIYATAQNMLEKSEEELKKLASLKLTMAYLGLESGSDKVLHMIVKGNNQQDMIQGSQKLIRSGMKLSIIAMLGIGGEKFSKEHVRDTASTINEISPHYFSFLTTMSLPGTPYFKMTERGLIKELTSKKMLEEMRDILKELKPKRTILFRANHVSNQFPLGGSLPNDSRNILETLDKWISTTPDGDYPPVPTSM
ncbi:MAG: radical SAM superfamily enzyme YgiQ (UPF0313 family) [Bacteriovoracaceae bacterium]|jgi:radical SAM superfamily enzyme YgiQ (UPF0313 family)